MRATRHLRLLLVPSCALAIFALALRLGDVWRILTDEWIAVFFSPHDAAIVDATRDAASD